MEGDIMSHIVEFYVEGLAGNKKPFSAKLDRNVNIIFGLNGSGKSSLLRIFHSAMQEDASGLTNVPFTKAEVKIYSKSFKKIFTYSLEKSIKKAKPDLGDEKPYIVTYTRGVRARIVKEQKEKPLKWNISPKKSKEELIGWHHRFLPTSRLYVPPDDFPIRFGGAHEEGTLEEEQLNELFAYTVKQLWTNYSSDILSIVRKTQEEGLASILKAVIASKKSGKTTKWLKSRIAYDRLKTFLKRQGSSSIIGNFENFEKRYKGDMILRDVVLDINNVEKKIEKAMAPRRKLEELLNKMFSGNKQVDLKDNTILISIDEETNITLDLLSSGEKHLIRILVEAMLADDSSFIIDEPEISMHIDWQAEFIQTIQYVNPQAQLIIATHSPEIMANIPEEKIFNL